MPQVEKYTAHFVGGPRDGAKDQIAQKKNFLYCGRVEDGIWEEWAPGRARYDLITIRDNVLTFKFLDYENA
jgi:hypothetical protein